MWPFLPSVLHEGIWTKITLSPIKSMEKPHTSCSMHGRGGLPGAPLCCCSLFSALHFTVNTLWPGWTGAAVTLVWAAFSWPQAAPEWLSGTCCPRPGFSCAGTAVSHRSLQTLWAARAGPRGYGTQWVLTQVFNDASLHYALHFFLTYTPWYILYWSLFLTSQTV